MSLVYNFLGGTVYDGERDLLAIPKFFCCVPDRRFVMGQMCRDISDAALTHRKQSVIDDSVMHDWSMRRRRITHRSCHIFHHSVTIRHDVSVTWVTSHLDMLNSMLREVTKKSLQWNFGFSGIQASRVRWWRVGCGQGQRHGFESGGTILRAERAKKIFDPPLFGQWGGQNIA